jgi:hypothetical protein
MRSYVQRVQTTMANLTAIVLHLLFWASTALSRSDSIFSMTSTFGQGRCPSKQLAYLVVRGRSAIDCGDLCVQLSTQTPSGGSRCVEFSHRQNYHTCALFTSTADQATFNAEVNCTHYKVHLRHTIYPRIRVHLSVPSKMQDKSSSEFHIFECI